MADDNHLVIDIIPDNQNEDAGEDHIVIDIPDYQDVMLNEIVVENPGNENNIATQFQLMQINGIDLSKQGFHCSIKNYDLYIWNQSRGICTALAVTQMLTIMYRMKTGNINLKLSPNALIHEVKDETGLSFEGAALVLANPHAGLEARPWNEPYREHLPDFAYIPGSQRYVINSHVAYRTTKEMVLGLCRNFGRDGNHYPIFGICHPLGSLMFGRVAAYTTKEDPYRWGDNNRLTDFYDNEGKLKNIPGNRHHAVVVTGIYVRVDNPSLLDYSIEIKNSWGASWGTIGFAWVTIDTFCQMNEAMLQ